MGRRQPGVITLPVAQHYAPAGTRIIEIASDAGGCLISMDVRDGRLRLEIYRADDTVDVITPGVSHGE